MPETLDYASPADKPRSKRQSAWAVWALVIGCFWPFIGLLLALLVASLGAGDAITIWLFVAAGVCGLAFPILAVVDIVRAEGNLTGVRLAVAGLFVAIGWVVLFGILTLSR